MFDPKPNFPFCPEQTDFLCFRGADGFMAIELNLIEGFAGAVVDGVSFTTVHLTNNSSYESTETVPELVARCAAIKKLRYDKTRGEREHMPVNPLVTPGSAIVSQPPAQPAPAKGIWTSGPATAPKVAES